MAWWQAVTADKMQEFLGILVAVDRQPVLRDGLPLGNPAYVHGEVGEAVSAAALLVELAEGEGPACFLLAAMLPHHSVKPALNAARQVKVGGVNAQHKPLIDDTIIEPVGDDKLKAERMALVVCNLLPLVQPAKAMVLFALALSYVGSNACCLQPI